MMYTDEEIEELRTRAEAWGLAGRKLLADAEAVKRDCNGIGAEWMGKYLRGALDKTNPTLRPTAAIHDRRYAEGNSRRQYPSEESARLAADMEFWENGLRSANARYGWYDLRRYRVREQVRKLYAALRIGGKPAWDAAKKEREARHE